VTTSAQALSHAGSGHLAIGIEPEGVRVCLVESVSGQFRLIGWLGLQRDPAMETPLLIANACRRFGQRIGRTLWNEQRQTPLIESDDPLRYPPLEQVALGLIARPRLRTWLAAVSQTPGLATLEAAVMAVPTQVVGRTTLAADLTSSSLARALAQAVPEALVVVGGYDGASARAQQPVLTLCQLLGEALAQLDVDRRPALFFAGAHEAAAQASALLSPVGAGGGVEVLPNIQPTPKQSNGRELARILTYYDWRLSERVNGYSRFSRWVTGPGQPSSLMTNFAQLTRLWLEQQGLAQLHGLYCTRTGWLHVLAERQQPGVQLCYGDPNTQPAPIQAWPPIGLVSGPWPGQPGRPARYFWWDRDGLAPIVAAIGQVAPQAMLETLVYDLFTPYEGEA
jgi:hypothetical protein